MPQNAVPIPNGARPSDEASLDQAVDEIMGIDEQIEKMSERRCRLEEMIGQACTSLEEKVTHAREIRDRDIPLVDRQPNTKTYTNR